MVFICLIGSPPPLYAKEESVELHSRSWGSLLPWLLVPASSLPSLFLPLPPCYLFSAQSQRGPPKAPTLE